MSLLSRYSSLASLSSFASLSFNYQLASETQPIKEIITEHVGINLLLDLLLD